MGFTIVHRYDPLSLDHQFEGGKTTQKMAEIIMTTFVAAWNRVLKQGKPNGISIYSNSMGSDCKGMRVLHTQTYSEVVQHKTCCCRPLNN